MLTIGDFNSFWGFLGHPVCYRITHPNSIVPNQVLNLISNCFYVSVITSGLVLKNITWSLNSTLISFSIVYCFINNFESVMR